MTVSDLVSNLSDGAIERVATIAEAVQAGVYDDIYTCATASTEGTAASAVSLAAVTPLDISMRVNEGSSVVDFTPRLKLMLDMQEKRIGQPVATIMEVVAVRYVFCQKSCFIDVS